MDLIFLLRPLWKSLPASDRADPYIPRRKRGKRHHHHGGNVVDCCVCGVRYFPYYSYSSKHTGREIFVPARTLIAVKQLMFKSLGK